MEWMRARGDDLVPTRAPSDGSEPRGGRPTRVGGTLGLAVLDGACHPRGNRPRREAARVTTPLEGRSPTRQGWAAKYPSERVGP